MRLVLDSSVLVKLLIEEPGSDQVFDLMERAIGEEVVLIISELALYEVGNVLWKNGRRRKSSEGPISELFELEMERVPITKELAEKTLKCALDMDITFYDAVHVVIANTMDAALVTEDNELLRKFKGVIDVSTALDNIP